jgi:hypothetical protein
MKKIALVGTTLALAMAAESAFAATAAAAANGPTAGSFGINVGFIQATTVGDTTTPAEENI